MWKHQQVHVICPECWQNLFWVRAGPWSGARFTPPNFKLRCWSMELVAFCSLEVNNDRVAPEREVKDFNVWFNGWSLAGWIRTLLWPYSHWGCLVQDTRLYLIQNKTACSIVTVPPATYSSTSWSALIVPNCFSRKRQRVFADAALNIESQPGQSADKTQLCCPQAHSCRDSSEDIFCGESPLPGIPRKSRECQTSVTLTPQLSQSSCPTPWLVSRRLTHWLTCRRSGASVGSKATHSCSLYTQGNGEGCCFCWCRRMSASRSNKSTTAECSRALVKQMEGKMSHKGGIWPWEEGERSSKESTSALCSCGLFCM